MSGTPTRVIHVSREAYKTLGRDEIEAFIDARDGGPWAIRGPRGGRYIADGPITWHVDEHGFYGPDHVRFIGRRDASRVTYVRPTSKAALARFEAIA